MLAPARMLLLEGSPSNALGLFRRRGRDRDRRRWFLELRVVENLSCIREEEEKVGGDLAREDCPFGV